MSTNNPPGSVLLNSINIITHAGQILDIRHIFSSIEIYESIFTHSMTAKIVIGDSVGLLASVPITGLETLTIDYQTNKDFPAVKLKFVLNKIQTLIGKDAGSVYVMELISFDFFMSTSMRLSKKIKGTLQEVVTDLLGPKTINTGTKVFIEEDSSNDIQFISNFWTPFECIKVATAKAISPSKDLFSSYLFYQTTHEYKASSISKLFTQDSLMSYVVSEDKGRELLDGGGSVLDMNKVYSNVLDFKVNSLMDFTKAVGMKGLNVITYHANPMRKKVSKIGYDYSSDFEKTDHLGAEPATEYSHMFPTISDQIVSTEVFDRYTHRVRERIPLITTLNLLSIDIEVHGLSKMEVGKVVNFTLPSFSSYLNDNVNDEMRSGRYIVASICHTINTSSHKMTMTILKDSLK